MAVLAWNPQSTYWYPKQLRAMSLQILFSEGTPVDGQRVNLFNTGTILAGADSILSKWAIEFRLLWFSEE